MGILKPQQLSHSIQVVTATTTYLLVVDAAVDGAGASFVGGSMAAWLEEAKALLVLTDLDDVRVVAAAAAAAAPFFSLPVTRRLDACE